MKKYYVLLILMLIIILYITVNAGSAFVIQNPSGIIEAYRNHSLVRLHVLANSDSPRDQFIKYQVKDRIENYLLANTNLLMEEEKLAGHVSMELTDRISSVLTEQKAGYSHRILYGNYYFPARNYKGLTLPAGEYRALKIILGEGTGANWWCVLMPPLDINRGPDGKQIMIRSKLVEFIRENEEYLTGEKSFISSVLRHVSKISPPNWFYNLAAENNKPEIDK